MGKNTPAGLFMNYHSIIGDGYYMYTQPDNTGVRCECPTPDSHPYMTSAENDGTKWTNYLGGAQTFIDGPFDQTFDKGNGIIYSANWDAGVWALKVISPNNQKITITNMSATPSSITNNINRIIVFNLKSKCTNGSVTNVSINLSQIGGPPSVKMTNI